MKPISLDRREVLKLLGAGAALLAGSPYSRLVPGMNPDSSKPNIFIIVFDAVTASHLSLYGYPRQTMPNLERFAEQATVYHQHYASGNYTTPGAASLLSGTYPWTHRAINMFDNVAPYLEDQNIFSLLAGQYTTITYTHNMLAAVVLDGFQNHIHQMHEVYEGGLHSGLPADWLFGNDLKIAHRVADFNLNNFSHARNSTMIGPLLHVLDKYMQKRYRRIYREKYPRGLPNNENRMLYTLEDTNAWLLELLPDTPQPMLGYFHFLPPHSPYNPSAEFVGRFEDGWEAPIKPLNPYFGSRTRDAKYYLTKRNQYDEFMAYADAGFADLLDGLAQQGLLDNSYIIFTTDHGEIFERGLWGHVNQTLYQPLIHIPLLVRAPGQTTRQDVYTPTSAIDILPTLCHIAGQPIPAWAEGRPLPAFTNESPDPQRPIFTIEAKESNKYKPFNKASIAMLQGEYKLTRYYGYRSAGDRYEFFNIAEDPEELDNIYSQEYGLAHRMKQELLAQLEQADQAVTRQTDQLD